MVWVEVGLLEVKMVGDRVIVESVSSDIDNNNKAELVDGYAIHIQSELYMEVSSRYNIDMGLRVDMENIKLSMIGVLK